MSNENNQNPPPKRNKNRRQRWILMLLGVVIGIVVVIAAMPSVLNTGLIPDKWTGQVEEQEQKQPQQMSSDSAGNDTSSATNDVNSDITTQLTKIVDKVNPTVVGISNLQKQGDNLWEEQDEESEAGTGSGVIYKKANGSAYIVTNHHVVEGADTVEVVLANGTHLEADLMGSDLFTDLAVLRMKDEQIDGTIEMGTSDNVQVGEPAIAIGNPLGMRFSGSVTQGIISGKQRTIPQDFNQDGRTDWQAEVMQTDAAINPGASGGALIDINGKLIGINSMKIDEEAVEGIGLAIPIDTARPIIEELEKSGKVTRPYLGVEIYSLDDVPQSEWRNTLNLPNKVGGGVYIWSIDSMTAADKAGLKRLDVITELDGKEVLDMIDLRQILYREKKVGDQVDVTYYRDGKQHTTTITLEEQ